MEGAILAGKPILIFYFLFLCLSGKEKKCLHNAYDHKRRVMEIRHKNVKIKTFFNL